jgi:hypothetical protein
MDLEWLWQGLVTELVGLVAAAVGAVVVAYLKARGSRWAAPIMYGLGGFALIAVSLFAFAGVRTFSKQELQMTPNTVEMNIRTWLDTFRLAVQREKDPQSYFTLRVTLPNQIPVTIRRTKELDRYILFETYTDVSRKHYNILEKLSKEQSERLIDELVSEVARLNVQWDVGASPLKRILLIKHVAITTGLTEAVFMDHLLEMGDAVILAGTRLCLVLSRTP